jgi:hypothetical protein
MQSTSKFKPQLGSILRNTRHASDKCSHIYCIALPIYLTRQLRVHYVLNERCLSYYFILYSSGYIDRLKGQSPDIGQEGAIREQCMHISHTYCLPLLSAHPVRNFGDIFSPRLD